MNSILHMTRLFFVVLTVLLSAVPSQAAETVTYLHPDTHGSPAVATDAAGNVVWRESFMPYGERRLKPPASAPNGLWYTGKVADDDTGLVYLGARWYDPGIGRFLAVDPAPVSEANVHSFNRYAYGNNNPHKFKDPNGKWPTYIHEASIHRVFRFLPEAERNILLRQQRVIDGDQRNEMQFKHALRIPGQSSIAAWAEANKFVREQLQIARDLEKSGKRSEALGHVGDAIHTLVDGTSPAHKGFQEFDSNWSRSKQLHHLLREFQLPTADEQREMDAATRRVWDLFTSDQPLPFEIVPRPYP